MFNDRKLLSVTFTSSTHPSAHVKFAIQSQRVENKQLFSQDALDSVESEFYGVSDGASCSSHFYLEHLHIREPTLANFRFKVDGFLKANTVYSTSYKYAINFTAKWRSYGGWCHPVAPAPNGNKYRSTIGNREGVQFVAAICVLELGLCTRIINIGSNQSLITTLVHLTSGPASFAEESVTEWPDVR